MKHFVNKIVVNFPEGIFEIEQGDDQRSLFASSFMDDILTTFELRIEKCRKV